MSKKEKIIYLTFDDGPIPDLTISILEILSKYNVKATFFCVGENMVKNPYLVEEIKKRGHSIGNHTYHHLKGWKTNNDVYIEDVEAFNRVYPTVLFRPPYGKIKWSQIKILKKRYKIILWSVLTYDFDLKISKETCLNLALKYSRPGSIIVFHDNIKARRNVMYALPIYIEMMKQRGYRFELISNDYR